MVALFARIVGGAAGANTATALAADALQILRASFLQFEAVAAHSIDAKRGEATPPPKTLVRLRLDPKRFQTSFGNDQILLRLWKGYRAVCFKLIQSSFDSVGIHTYKKQPPDKEEISELLHRRSMSLRFRTVASSGSHL